MTTDSLVLALYGGVFEKPLWSSFLEQLRAQTRARYVALMFRPQAGNAISEFSCGEAPSQSICALFGDDKGREPLPYRDMREGRVYALEELIDPSGPLHRTFSDAALTPWGMNQMRVVRIAEPGGTYAWLSCSGGREIGSSTSAILTGLAPHLRIALRSFMTMQRDRFRAEVTSEAIRKLNFGWLTLDARCRIVDLAPHADQIFEQTTALRRDRYDRLTPASPKLDRELSALVKGFAADPTARPGALQLSRDPMIDMLVAPVQERMMIGRSQPVAIAYIRGDLQSRADRCDQLVDLFGLLPSEARLAWAIAQGASIAEAAQQLGLTLETARNYSKKVYAKTGARGQAELVRNILTSVLAMA